MRFVLSASRAEDWEECIWRFWLEGNGEMSVVDVDGGAFVRDLPMVKVDPLVSLIPKPVFPALSFIEQITSTSGSEVS